MTDAEAAWTFDRLVELTEVRAVLMAWVELSNELDGDGEVLSPDDRETVRETLEVLAELDGRLREAA